MRIRTRLIVVSLLLSPGLLIAAEGGSEGSSCLQNLSVSGGFGAGKVFLVSQDHEGVPYPVAFRKTVAAIESDGLLQIAPNERTGYIAAENPVKGSGGATVPLRVTVRRQEDASIRVEARFSTKGGQLAPNKAVGAWLCTFADAASL